MNINININKYLYIEFYYHFIYGSENYTNYYYLKQKKFIHNDIDKCITVFIK